MEHLSAEDITALNYHKGYTLRKTINLHMFLPYKNIKEGYYTKPVLASKKVLFILGCWNRSSNPMASNTFPVYSFMWDFDTCTAEPYNLCRPIETEAIKPPPKMKFVSMI